MWRLRGSGVSAFNIKEVLFSCTHRVNSRIHYFFASSSPQVLSNQLLHTPSNKSIQMQIIVTVPAGASMAYAVEDSTTIADLKSMIENTEFIPGHLIRLMSGDSELVEGTLAGLGIEEDDELALMLEVPGGMRAKWRKKRMRRLRRKRRKMRQRAR